MTTFDPTASFEINGQTFAPGDPIVVDFRAGASNDRLTGIFSGTADLTADAGRTVLGAAIVVNYEGDDVVITAAEVLAVATPDDDDWNAMAEIEAFAR
jgi:hypothetical protein